MTFDTSFNLSGLIYSAITNTFQTLLGTWASEKTFPQGAHGPAETGTIQGDQWCDKVTVGLRNPKEETCSNMKFG